VQLFAQHGNRYVNYYLLQNMHPAVLAPRKTGGYFVDLKEKILSAFIKYRSPSRRFKERRQLHFFGGFKGIDRRKNPDREKGILSDANPRPDSAGDILPHNPVL
jgi:hypothetical protein